MKQDQLTEEFKKSADDLIARIDHLSRVSPDVGYREGFNLEALRRAERAAREDKVFLSGYGKGVLILGISALGEEKAERFIRRCAGWKSHVNNILCLLDGEEGEIRKNKAGSCWVIDLYSSRKQVMFAWESGPREVRFAGPRLNTTNGGAHWCGVLSENTPFNVEKSPRAVSFLARSQSCWKEHGLTLLQWQRQENLQKEARILRDAEIARVSREAKKLADEEARIMAELEAEQIKLVYEKAKADSEAKKLANIMATCSVLGVTLEDWQAMTMKKQGQALHKARLAGKIR